MTETLFERYKEALRAGHVAVLHGRLEEAAASYRAAIAVAADRPVPRTALGGVLLRMGDPAAALEAYDGALGLVPDEEAALLGRAQALVVLRRAAEAAATYDRLAAVAEAAADRTEAARRAVAIEPTDERRSRHATLAGLPGGAAGAAPEPGTPPSATGPVPEPDVPPATEPAAPSVAEAEEQIVTAVEAAARGDHAAAAAAALAAARAHRAGGRRVAAMDACLLGIASRPADVELHLLLADLAAGPSDASGAADARQRLLRLAELDRDAAAADRVREAIAATSGDRAPTS